MKEENHTIILRDYGKYVERTIFRTPHLNCEMNSECFNLSLQCILQRQYILDCTFDKLLECM